jgi:hypothetical protein
VAARPSAANEPERRTRENQGGESGGQQGRRLSNDRALYNCQCGYVFEAPVSTSVGCPHCGCTQAW